MKRFVDSLHMHIWWVIKNGNLRFETKDFGYKQTNNVSKISEKYHLNFDNKFVDVYCIVATNTKQEYKSIDLHCTMNVGDTVVHTQETNTEFAKNIYELIRKKCKEQNVK